MAKTYIPTLRTIVKQLCVYITRYNVVIRSNLSGDALTAFNALSLACDGFLTAIGEEPINP